MITSRLTRPLLEKALLVARGWPAGLRLSFNLSGYDLTSSEGVLAVVATIEKSGFEARRLELEITETAFTRDFGQLQESIPMLRNLGCGISLDNFGTGYSSLSRLHALPLTKINVDRDFVTDLHEKPASYKIVKSLLALSGDMKIDCIVEGVETGAEMATLKELGGVLVQGYFYSPPPPALRNCGHPGAARNRRKSRLAERCRMANAAPRTSGGLFGASLRGSPAADILSCLESLFRPGHAAFRNNCLV